MKILSISVLTSLVFIVIEAWNLNICIIYQHDAIIPKTDLSFMQRDVVDAFTNRSRFPGIILTTTVLDIDDPEFLQFSHDECSNVPSGCHGIVTIADCSHASLINVWASNHVIPHVILSEKTCLHTPKFGIKLTPYFQTENDAIAAIINNEYWTEIVILHDESLDPTQKITLVNQLSNMYIGIMSLRIETTNTTDNLFQQLKTILQLQYRNILLIANIETIRQVLKTAQDLSMLDALFFWIINSDLVTPETMVDINANRSNIVVIQRARNINNRLPCRRKPDVCLSLDNNKLYQLRLLDALDVLTSAIVLTKTAEVGRVPYNTCGTDVIEKELRHNITIQLDQTDMMGNLGQLKFDGDGYPGGLEFNMCSIHDTVVGDINTVGYWSPTTGLVLPQSVIFPYTFKDFRNQTLIIGTLQAIPFTIKYQDGNMTQWKGFCIDILDELALRSNFNYVIAEPADVLWGAPEDDGVWNGVVGEVVRGNFAFGVGPFTITSIRDTVIDFTKPYTEEGIGILTRRPNSESQKMFKMFTPFAPEVWACIVASVVVVGILLHLVNRVSPYSDHKLHPQTERMTVKESLWLVYGSYMEQGGEPHPRSVSGRLILGFWWLFTILMASTYTANLAAFLTVTIAEKPINSLTELSDQVEIKPLAKYGSNLFTLFKESEDGIYKDIWGKMSDMPKLSNNDAALEYVLEGKTAFMTDRSQLEYIVLNDCETYSLADEAFNTAGLGFIVPENAPFSDVFNYNIMKMQEAGLIDKWRHKWWPSSDKCSGSDRTSQAMTLDLDSLAGPFFIFLSVAMMSAILLLMELCYHSSTIISFTKWLNISGKQLDAEPEKE